MTIDTTYLYNFLFQSFEAIPAVRETVEASCGSNCTTDSSSVNQRELCLLIDSASTIFADANLSVSSDGSSSLRNSLLELDIDSAPASTTEEEAEYYLELVDNAAQEEEHLLSDNEPTQTSSINLSPNGMLGSSIAFNTSSNATRKPTKTTTSGRHSWTPEQDRALLPLVELYKHKWSQISKHLSATLGITLNRWQCFHRWKVALDPALSRNLSTKTTPESWTPAQDQRLKNLFELYGNNWKTISEHFVDDQGLVLKTRKQCSNRWRVYLDPAISHSQWSKNESDELVKLVQKYGENNWVLIAKELSDQKDKKRTAEQCRQKWVSGANPKIHQGKWSPEEDEKLKLLYTQLGNQWTLIASHFQYPDGTTRNLGQCRSRWKNVSKTHKKQ